MLYKLYFKPKSHSHLYGFARLPVEKPTQSSQVASRDSQDLLLCEDERRLCGCDVVRELPAGRRSGIVQLNALYSTYLSVCFLGDDYE
jgi:hypothetical protein